MTRYTGEEIAEAVGMSQKAVNIETQELVKSDKWQKLLIFSEYTDLPGGQNDHLAKTEERIARANWFVGSQAAVSSRIAARRVQICALWEFFTKTGD